MYFPALLVRDPTSIRERCATRLDTHSARLGELLPWESRSWRMPCPPHNFHYCRSPAKRYMDAFPKVDHPTVDQSSRFYEWRVEQDWVADEKSWDVPLVPRADWKIIGLAIAWFWTYWFILLGFGQRKLNLQTGRYCWSWHWNGYLHIWRSIV